MRGMRRLTLVVAAALLGVLALNAVPAIAKTGYQDICPTLGTAICTPFEGRRAPRGLAVDNSGGTSAGDVWVAYGFYYPEGDMRLVKYDPRGEEIGEAETESLSFNESGEPLDVAVGPANGDVYLSSTRREIVVAFTAEGDPTGVQVTETPEGRVVPSAVAVDGEGNIYIVNARDDAVDKFDSSGAYVGSIVSLPEVGQVSLAVGPEDDLYVGLAGEVRRYSTSGAPVDCPGAGNALHREGGGLVAVDPSDGHLFVEEATATEGKLITEYSSLCATTWTSRFAKGEVAEGIGVNGSTHGVYIGAESFVDVYGVVTLPAVATGSASDVTRSSAAVAGTVVPEGAEVTSCEFEYGPTIYYGQSAPCSQVPPFAGETTVGATLSFVLPPGGAIHYRLKVGSPAGDEYGQDEFFVREAPPTVVSTLPATGVAQFGATLHGVLETGEEVANYHFEYGTTTGYGQIAPIPDGYSPPSEEPFAVTQPVQGLQAGTTYHYRLVASSPGGTEVEGPDETFTTLSVPAPAVSTGAVEGVGVAQATLTGAVDPQGWETTYLFEYGTSTAYGSDWPTVPVSMGALEGSQPVLVTVPGLQPGTTYHVRLVASNAGGTTYGPDMTFTTGSYPVEPVQEPAAIKTLLVPSEPGKIVSIQAKKKKKSNAKRKSKKKRRGTKKNGHTHGGRSSRSRPHTSTRRRKLRSPSVRKTTQNPSSTG